MIRKYYQSFLVFLAIGTMISLVSCNPARKYEKDEKEAIENFLNSSSIEFTQTESGLYYYENETGTGIDAEAHDTAYVRYTGKYLNGTVFDTNVGNNKTDFKFPIGQGYAIYGFDEGVSLMKAGGKSTLLIPSSLGYGTQGYYTIPGYTALLFEIELVRVVKGPTK